MKKIKSFDGIRTIAFIMIFMSHIGRNISVVIDFCFGAVGVQIFFILSGFLCLLNWCPSSYNIFKESFFYYLKKLKKFYPLHILTFYLAFCLQLWWIYKYGASDTIIPLIKASIPEILLIQTFFINSGGYFNWVAWFLADLLFCYFLTPLLIRLTKKCKSVSKILLFMFTVKIIQILIVIISPAEYSYYFIYVFPCSRLFDFEMGILLGELYLLLSNKISEKIVFVFQGFSILLLVFLMTITYMIKIDTKYTNTLLFEESICLLIFCSAMDTGCISRFLGNIFFKYFSSIIMPFFLFHQLVIRYLEEYSTSFSYIGNIKFYVLCFIISLILSIIWNWLQLLFEMKMK